MTRKLNRRSAVREIAAGVGALALSRAWARGADSKVAVPITGVSNDDLAPFDELMLKFVEANQVPGAALAVSRQSKLVYARGFGHADVDAKRTVEPNDLFRIASISKPFTSTAVMQLVEQSKLQLDAHVFDVLPAQEWLPQEHDERLRKITIRQLLLHTGGWDREKSFDPIGRVNDIARFVGKPLPIGPADVIKYTLSLPLDFDPGTRYAYYNVDYLVLGRLIEHASGENYEAYVKKHVLAPLGITRMQLGRAWKEDLAKGEVCYYDPKHRERVAICGSKLHMTVPMTYGAENVEGYEAHGGWVASAPDLVRYASAFDDVTSCKLLKPETIKTMWSRPEGTPGHEADGKPKPVYYACGWNVRPVGEAGNANIWHSGLISGTSTILVRRSDGLNWAVLFNTHQNADGKTLSGIVDPLVHQAANAVKHWPDQAIEV